MLKFIWVLMKECHRSMPSMLEAQSYSRLFSLILQHSFGGLFAVLFCFVFLGFSWSSLHSKFMHCCPRVNTCPWNWWWSMLLFCVQSNDLGDVANLLSAVMQSPFHCPHLQFVIWEKSKFSSKLPFNRGNYPTVWCLYLQIAAVFTDVTYDLW